MSDVVQRFIAAMAAMPHVPLPGQTLVVAVSGGADSMALWDLLVRAGTWRLVVWHLDHGLRADAPQDLALIRAQAAAYHVSALGAGEVIAEHTDVAALARQWRVSLEAAGRRHRYDRLVAVARERAAVAVLTAHHRDDQSETVLANLLRGAGPVGLAGIAPRRLLPGGIALLRPLLALTRADLRAHCARFGVAWRDDTTNDDLLHQRNFLRHGVLPGLEAGVPGLAAALAELAERNQDTSQALELATQEPWQRALGADDLLLEAVLPLASDLRLHVWRRLVLHLGAPLERSHLRRIDQLAHASSGQRLHLGRWLLLRRPHSLAWELARPLRNELQVEIAGPGDHARGAERMECQIIAPPARVLSAGGDAYLDAYGCSWPLRWRPACEHESFTPLGAPGRQTVVKFLSTRGVPSRLRPGAPVVADGHGVVWVPGFSIAERVKVTASTREVVHLRWTPACGTDAAPTVPPRQEETDERS